MLTEEEPWHSEGIHKMVVGKYLVYFWINDTTGEVWITAVVYDSRDQRQQLAEMQFKIKTGYRINGVSVQYIVVKVQDRVHMIPTSDFDHSFYQEDN